MRAHLAGWGWGTVLLLAACSPPDGDTPRQGAAGPPPVVLPASAPRPAVDPAAPPAPPPRVRHATASGALAPLAAQRGAPGIPGAVPLLPPDR